MVAPVAFAFHGTTASWPGSRRSIPNRWLSVLFRRPPLEITRSGNPSGKMPAEGLPPPQALGMCERVPGRATPAEMGRLTDADGDGNVRRLSRQTLHAPLDFVRFVDGEKPEKAAA